MLPMSLILNGSSFSSSSPVWRSSFLSIKKYVMNIIRAIISSTTPKATERDTSMSPPIFAKTGEKIMHVATPSLANAISDPIANAISRPLNHLTMPRETVMPAISTPQPNIMKPMAANLAEAGIPS